LPVEVKAYRPGIWQIVEKEFEVVKIFPGTLGGGEVYVCRQRPGKQSGQQSEKTTVRFAK
jgi:hypothetical protein